MPLAFLFKKNLPNLGAVGWKIGGVAKTLLYSAVNNHLQIGQVFKP